MPLTCWCLRVPESCTGLVALPAAGGSPWRGRTQPCRDWAGSSVYLQSRCLGGSWDLVSSVYSNITELPEDEHFIKYSVLIACFESTAVLAKLSRIIPCVFTGCRGVLRLFWRECTLLWGLKSCYYKLIPLALWWAQWLSAHSDVVPRCWGSEMEKLSIIKFQ